MGISDKFAALVVDDNYDNRVIFCEALEQAGYETSDAEDGEKALAILNQRIFNLLILDLQMPNLDGVTTLRRLRKDPRHANMRIIIATANPQMVTGDVDLLVDYVLNKPFDLKEFILLARRIKSSF